MIDHNLSVIIQRVVRTELGKDSVIDISVNEASDFAGNPIYRICVTLDAKNPPNKQKMAGLVRHVMSAIEGQSEYFPIFRFLSNAEKGRGKIATA